MSLLKSKKVLAYIEKQKERQEKKPPVPKVRERAAPAVPPTPRRHRYTPKEKAQYAIEQRGGDRWMQKWIDWNDNSTPVGMRRVAFVRYLTMVKGYALDKAKYESKYKIH